ncbi:related to Probable transporter MCH4 [Saccharomycodes ludwigii]|uniref:Related to Probable transporter MCH4 n=1 Tax=Saccharomycodes ludwigii TaxID=36035 RepID=A0A376B717_9ASCO|nr:related to Probable transporter MCH4 [Saccharomycodes ludwigii]
MNTSTTTATSPKLPKETLQETKITLGTTRVRCSESSITTEAIANIEDDKQNKQKENTYEWDDEDKLLKFPDGGPRAYLSLFGSMCGLITVFGVLNSVGAIQAYLQENQLKNEKNSTISWIFAIYTFTLFFSCIFCGCYFDRNGCSKINYLASICCIVGIFCMAECTKVYQFILSFSILFGFGSGILMTSLISCVATFFKKKRGIANSIASLGGSIGGIVFPIMLRKLYSLIGFANAIRVLGGIVTFTLIISLLLTSENPLVMNYVQSDNHTKGYVGWMKKLKIYLKNSIDVKSIFNYRNPKFLFCYLGCAFAENGLTVSATYFASYCITRGVSQSKAYSLVTVINAFGVLGRISGYIADKYTGKFQMLVISLLLITILNFVMWLPFGYDLKVLYAYSALYGFVCSSILSLTPVAIGQICKIEEFGVKYGTMYFITALLSLPIIEIGGVIIGNGQSIASYNKFIIYCTILNLSSGICYAISRIQTIGFKKGKF